MYAGQKKWLVAQYDILYKMIKSLKYSIGTKERERIFTHYKMLHIILKKSIKCFLVFVFLFFFFFFIYNYFLFYVS